jgi:hypothetical protein
MGVGITEDDLRRIREFVETPEKQRTPDMLRPVTDGVERIDDGRLERRADRTGCRERADSGDE